MRHQPQTEAMTRLLIQKPVAYAEIEENSRIALSILTEDGWTIDRIGMDMRVKIIAEATIQQVDSSALASQLAASQLQFAALRSAIVEHQAARSEQLAMVAGLSLVLCNGIAWIGLSRWLLVPAILLICAAGWMNQHRTKGAK